MAPSGNKSPHFILIFTTNRHKVCAGIPFLIFFGIYLQKIVWLYKHQESMSKRLLVAFWWPIQFLPSVSTLWKWQKMSKECFMFQAEQLVSFFIFISDCCIFSKCSIMFSCTLETGPQNGTGGSQIFVDMFCFCFDMCLYRCICICICWVRCNRWSWQVSRW